MRPILILSILGLIVAPLHAQSRLTTNTLTLDDASNMPSATVEDVAWLAGHWRGEFLGGQAEEVWSPPSGGSMLGMFKLVRDGASSFYEIMTLTEENGGVVLKLKHFNPDLTGWEEKDEHVAFPLAKIEDNAAYFDGLTLKRVGLKTLQGYLAMHGSDGMSEIAFTYSAVD